DRGNRARMSPTTIRLAVQRLAEDGLLGPALTVTWHAGEPLTLPPGYYEEAFDAIAEAIAVAGPAAVPVAGASAATSAGAACRVTHAFQTNGTLIDEAWCALFTHHRVRVGISIDGPADLHDRHRRTRAGAGTHARVMRGLRQLQAHGIAVHAIAVLG